MFLLCYVFTCVCDSVNRGGVHHSGMHSCFNINNNSNEIY